MVVTRNLGNSPDARGNPFRPGLMTVLIGFATVMVGCAHVDAGSQLTRADLPCLPPGATAHAFTWPVVDARPVPVPFETGDVRPGLWVRYQEGELAVVMLWSSTGLFAVDPNPDTDVPAWLDTGLVGEDGKTLKATPTTRCRWRQRTERQSL
jgi:hypothetical protein